MSPMWHCQPGKRILPANWRTCPLGPRVVLITPSSWFKLVPVVFVFLLVYNLRKYLSFLKSEWFRGICNFLVHSKLVEISKFLSIRKIIFKEWRKQTNKTIWNKNSYLVEYTCVTDAKNLYVNCFQSTLISVLLSEVTMSGQPLCGKPPLLSRSRNEPWLSNSRLLRPPFDAALGGTPSPIPFNQLPTAGEVALAVEHCRFKESATWERQKKWWRRISYIFTTWPQSPPSIPKKCDRK